MRALALMVFLILCTTTLASCGHKAPLQLPEPNETAENTVVPEA